MTQNVPPNSLLAPTDAEAIADAQTALAADPPPDHLEESDRRLFAEVTYRQALHAEQFRAARQEFAAATERYPAVCKAQDAKMADNTRARDAVAAEMREKYALTETDRIDLDTGKITRAAK